jgi:hypothetical protein
MKCPYCYFNCGPHGNPGPSTALASKYIEKLADIGIETIMIAGGEPFLRKDIIKLIKKGKSLGIDMGVITNASLCTYDILEQINTDLALLSVSLDAPDKKLNDTLRFHGSYDSAMRTFKSAGELKIPFFIYFTIQHKNFDLIPEMYELANRVGAAGMYFKGIFNNSNEVFSIKQIWSKLNNIQKNTRLKIDAGCFAYGRSFYLNPNGILYPCQMMMTDKYDYSIGSLLSLQPDRFEVTIFGGKIKADKMSCPFVFSSKPRILVCSSPDRQCPMTEQ